MASYRLFSSGLPTIICYAAIAFVFVSCLNGSTLSGTDPDPAPFGWEQRHVLSNAMTIDVFTPESYHENTNYPLLILNDGEQMFGSGGWNMHQVLQELIDNGEIKPVIAVAIHAGGMRNNWYVPYVDDWVRQNWGPYTPQAAEYAQAIFGEVLPFMNQNYPFDEQEVGILGASLGGLISTWMGLKFPDKIKYSASLSGSFWVAEHSIFTEVNGPYNEGHKFWFDVGTGEWNYYVPLYSSLENTGAIPGTGSFYYEVPDAQHTTHDWLQRIRFPLKVFYGTEQNPKPKSMDVVLECILSQSTPGLSFRRLNPIITLSNGVRYSLAHTATYSLISGEAELGSEGSLRNNPDTEVKVRVEYQSFSREITIPKGWCR